MNNDFKHTGCTHLRYVTSMAKWQKTIQKIEQRIIESKTEFDSIAFQGASGTLVGPMLAFLLNKEIILILKPSEKQDAHRCKIEGNANSKRFIIVDDLIETGKTVRNILKEISGYNL